MDAPRTRPARRRITVVLALLTGLLLAGAGAALGATPCPHHTGPAAAGVMHHAAPSSGHPGGGCPMDPADPLPADPSDPSGPTGSTCDAVCDPVCGPVCPGPGPGAEAPDVVPTVGGRVPATPAVVAVALPEPRSAPPGRPVRTPGPGALGVLRR